MTTKPGLPQPLSRAEEQSSVRQKRAYATPRLTTFGSVGELTGAMTNGSFTDAVGMMVMAPSDRALKEGILRVGEHAAGFGLYLFSYKPEFRDACGHGRQFGVMADEVELIVPEAVSVGGNGFKVVNYGLIGVHRHHQ